MDSLGRYLPRGKGAEMKLYVGNLSYDATEGDLEKWFTEAAGAVDSVTLVRDRFSGQARGFGFVEINDDEQAEAAIQSCNGKELMGRPLVVNEARPKVPRLGGGGEGGGDYQGDRRGGPSSKRGKRGRPKRW